MRLHAGGKDPDGGFFDQMLCQLGRETDPLSNTTGIHAYQGRLILQPDYGTHLFNGEYQAFLRDHNVIRSMSVVGYYGDNAAEEGLFGLLNPDNSSAG